MRDQKRVIGYDYLRVIAIFMVVVIHGNVAFIAGNNESSNIIAMWIDAFCLVAVPCFLMISGALLLESESSFPLKNMRKRFTKQGIPFLVWSFIYVFFRIILKKIPFDVVS